MFFFFFKQKTAYELRISDWSSDVCSSDLLEREGREAALMRADAFAVELDARAIIDRAEAEKLAFAGFGIGGELALIPDHPPIMAHRRVLRPPRRPHRRGGRPRHTILAERTGLLAPRRGPRGRIVQAMRE